MNIQQMQKALKIAREKDGFSTLLGIGPMSPMLLRATLELSKEQDFPVLFIASRNQVDMDEFGGGYVSGWDQKRFVKAIHDMAKKIDYDGQYFICRDHGGPWQRDEERRARLPEKEAMERGLTLAVQTTEANALPVAVPTTHGTGSLAARLRGRATTHMSTDDIMKLTRSA